MSVNLIPAKKILVLVPRFIGDLVNTSSALQILVKHHPNAKIYLMARPNLEPVCKRLGDFGFVSDPRQSGKAKGTLTLIKTIKALEFDMAVLLTNTLFDALIIRLAGIPLRLGYQNENRAFLLTHWLRRNPNRHYINLYAYIANLACNNLEKLLPTPVLKVLPYTLPTTQKNVTLALYFGCEAKAPRYYPTAETVELLTRLDRDYSVRLVFIGAPFEEDATQRTITKLPATVECVNLCGKTALEEMIDVIAACDGLITIDSSPLHIAAAINKPVVILESQGFSPYSCIQPKHIYSWAASSRWRYINDEDQVLDLPVEHIERAVAKMMTVIEVFNSDSFSKA